MFGRGDVLARLKDVIEVQIRLFVSKVCLLRCHVGKVCPSHVDITYLVKSSGSWIFMWQIFNFALRGEADLVHASSPHGSSKVFVLGQLSSTTLYPLRYVDVLWSQLGITTEEIIFVTVDVPLL